MVGVLVALWSANAGTKAIIDALNVAYGEKETRSFWHKRLIALIATLLGALLFIASFGLLAFGHRIADMISVDVGNRVQLQAPWEIGRWCASLALMIVGLDRGVIAEVEFPSF